MPVEHFKSKQAYRKNLAYRHMHGIPFSATSVVVGGKKRAVRHRDKRKSIGAAMKGA